VQCDDDAYCRQISGRTKTAEVGQQTHMVNIFYTEPLEQIAVMGMLPSINVTQLMAIDKRTSDARFVNASHNALIALQDLSNVHFN